MTYNRYRQVKAGDILALWPHFLRMCTTIAPHGHRIHAAAMIHRGVYANTQLKEVNLWPTRSKKPAADIKQSSLLRFLNTVITRGPSAYSKQNLQEATHNHPSYDKTN